MTMRWSSQNRDAVTRHGPVTEMITTQEIRSLGWIGCERLPSGVCNVIRPGGYREALDGPDCLYLFCTGWAFFRNGRWIIETPWRDRFRGDALWAVSTVREATPEESAKFLGRLLSL